MMKITVGMICGILYFIYRHWDELSMGELTQTLGLHREGVIGAPLTAAGEMVGGLFYYNYPGGSGLSSGMVFGRLAGASAGQDAMAMKD